MERTLKILELERRIHNAKMRGDYIEVGRLVAEKKALKSKPVYEKTGIDAIFDILGQKRG